MGAYFNVLRTLNLHEDFLKLPVDDELGRKLQDLNLLGRKPIQWIRMANYVYQKNKIKQTRQYSKNTALINIYIH